MLYVKIISIYQYFSLFYTCIKRSIHVVLYNESILQSLYEKWPMLFITEDVDMNIKTIIIWNFL